MYKIYNYDTEELIAQVAEPRWIKLNPDSGAWVECPAYQAEAVAVDGIKYSIEGHELIEDTVAVTIKFVEDTAESLRHSTDLDLLAWTIQKLVEEIVAAKSDSEKLAYALRKISEELESADGTE